MRKVPSGLCSINTLCSVKWFLLADSEGSDQTAHMRRLDWAFAVRICPTTRFRMVGHIIIYFGFDVSRFYLQINSMICWRIAIADLKYEPDHSFSYKIACAPSEDSDQPAHPRRLIWVFAVLKTLGYPGSVPAKTLNRLHWCTGWS